jgi:environmental stress-induced protein Ves
MQIEIIRKKEQTNQNWSGGATTQLFIFPKTAVYAERNFRFRISTATVEQEKSDFTQLPGIERILMILEGELKISHKNHYSKFLRKFDIDQFSGDWETSSEGKVTDFNVMTNGNSKVEINAFSFYKNEKIKKYLSASSGFTAVYTYKGNVDLFAGNQKITINEGDFIIFEKKEKTETLDIFSNTGSELIFVEIY